MVMIRTPVCAMCSSGCHSHPPIVSKKYCLTDGNPPTLYGCSDLDLHGGGFAGRILWSYNHERPHMALGGITPKQRLAMLRNVYFSVPTVTAGLPRTAILISWHQHALKRHSLSQLERPTSKADTVRRRRAGTHCSLQGRIIGHIFATLAVEAESL